MGGWGAKPKGMEGWEWARRGRTSQSCFLTFSGMALSQEWLGTCWLKTGWVGKARRRTGRGLENLGGVMMVERPGKLFLRYECT